MLVSHPHLKCIVAAALLSVAISLPLPGFAQGADGAAEGPEEPAADLTDESALLAQLAVADADEARRLDRQLQALWARSGSAAMDLLLERARDAIEAGDTATAIEHLTALTDHAPDFAEGWHARASAYFQADLYGPAVADLERALALNPRNYNAIFGLGAILETFGDTRRAYEAYQRVRALHPHHEAVGEALERLKPRIEGQSL
ncbi:MAG: tetratricopeptide repeat protein [Rhodobacteraceae bacterium]|nr:MAG: tetratricopeptide repeat protein [Paracoccaceae bacterium]